MIPDLLHRNGFSLERIATLCSVIHAGSIAAAAGPNPARQAQFSRQIKELEGALGAQLFVRVGKTLQPTPIGQRLARMSLVYFGAVAELAAAEAAKPSVVNVGGGEGILRWLLVPSLSVLQELAPPVHCRVRSLRSADVIGELELGRIDLGLVRTTAIPEHFSTETVGVFEFVFVVPRGLLRSKSAEEVFEGEPTRFAELMGDGILATSAREISGQAGIQLNRVIQAETLSLLLTAVENGHAAAFLPTVAAIGLPAERFAILRFEGLEKLSRKIALTWVQEMAEQKPVLSQVVRVLVRSLKDTMANATRLTAGSSG